MPRANRTKLTVTRQDTRSFIFDDVAIRAFEHDDYLWMDANHVCDVLKYQNVAHFLEMLDADEYRIEVLPTTGGPQKVTFVSEPGLYRGIMGSRVPAAKRFKRWVTHTVLPEISRTGQFKGKARSEEPIEMADIIRMMLLGREDGMYIATMVNGTFEVSKWDKHVFMTGRQRRIFDMLTLFFTRAYLNYCDDGLLKYVPKHDPFYQQLREFDWVLGGFLLAELCDFTENAILPAREMVKECELRAERARLASPGEDLSLVRLKQAGFISDDGKGGHTLNRERLEAYAVALSHKHEMVTA